jgi:membrane protease YdiL (CAAX protease family)
MLVLSLGLIYLLRDRLGYRIAWPKPKLILRPMLYGLLAAFVTNFILGILFFFLGATAEKHPAIEGMTVLQYLVFIIILAPIAEEHLFRGFLQNYLKPLKDKGFNLFGLRITFPVLMSAIAFSMAHLILLASGASGLFVTRVLVFTFVLGLIAGYYQEKHDNIAYAILVHAAGNILGLMSTILTAG